MTKKILLMITALIAAVTLSAAPIGLTANATYYTKYLDNGLVAFEDVAVAGVTLEAYNFVAGVNTFNTIKDTTTGKYTASAGLFKRVDLSLGYKFTSPLANLTLGGTYKTYSKSVSNIVSNTEPFALLNGSLFGTRATWDARYRADLKNHTNNTEANLRLPFGFQHVKLVPAIGYGFNDLGADTIVKYRFSKQYAVVGAGIGYYAKNATLSVDFTQRRDGLLTAGTTVNSVSGGIAVKF
jgi:hypothetical protein